MLQRSNLAATAAEPFQVVISADDETRALALLAAHVLEREGLDVRRAASREEAAQLAAEPATVLVLDLGRTAAPIPEALQARPLPVIVSTAPPADAARARVLFVEAPKLPVLLREVSRAAQQLARGLSELESVRAPGAATQEPTARDLGLSPAGERSDELARTLAAVASRERPVVIQGAAGTGKKHVARAIHGLSRRASHPLVVVDGAKASPQDLVAAHGGTLVVERAEAAPPALAHAIRSIADERRVDTHTVDARVILTTAQELGPTVFRDELARVLESAQRLRLPSLRERPDELIALAGEFLDEAAERLSVPAFELSLDAAERLLSHAWPGNVRELRAVCDQAATAARASGVIRAEDLAPPLGRAGASAAPTLAHVVDAVERELIVRSLVAHRGKLAEIGRVLGVAPRTLRRKIAHHSLRGEARKLRRTA